MLLHFCRCCHSYYLQTLRHTNQRYCRWPLLDLLLNNLQRTGKFKNLWKASHVFTWPYLVNLREIGNILTDTADLWKFCIILTHDSEVSLSPGTEGEAATYQLSWRERSIFKGQMKGLAVHYFVCAIHWRIKILQKAREWLVEDDRWTKHTEKKKSSALIQKLCWRAKQLLPYFISFLSLLWEEDTVFSLLFSTKLPRITKTE